MDALKARANSAWRFSWNTCLPLIAMIAMHPAAAWSQSAAVTLTEAVGTNITDVNGGGFSIVSDGSLRHQGPLNAVVPIDSVDRARIVINDVVLMNGVPLAVQEQVESGERRANTLSPDLVNASMDLGDQNNVAVGIGGQVPTYVKLGGILESQRSVVMSGQSFTTFPDNKPSVFSRSILP